MPPTSIPVYNVADYGAVGDGDLTKAATNTTKINNAISDIIATGGPAILYFPPSPPQVGGYGPNSQGYAVTNNGINPISVNNVVIAGAGSMGSNGYNYAPPPQSPRAGSSTIIGCRQGIPSDFRKGMHRKDQPLNRTADKMLTFSTGLFTFRRIRSRFQTCMIS